MLYIVWLQQTHSLLNIIKCSGIWFQKVAPLARVFTSVSRYKITHHTQQSHHKILVHYNLQQILRLCIIHNKLLPAEPKRFNTVSQPAIGSALSISWPGNLLSQCPPQSYLQFPSWCTKWTTFNIFVNINSVWNIIH